MRFHTCLVAGSAALTLIVGCGGGGPATSGAPGVAPKRNACTQRSPSLSGDVDGDGKADRLTILAHDTGPKAAPGCVYALVVGTASGTQRYGLGTRNYNRGAPRSAAPPGRPKLAALARIDDRPGLEIAVDVWEGASTIFANVLTIRSGKLETLLGDSTPPGPDGRAFAYGGTVTHQDGVDCAGRRRIVASTASAFQGERWKVTRQFYDVERGEIVLAPSQTQRATVPYDLGSDNLEKRFPELSGLFPSCAKVTPAR